MTDTEIINQEETQAGEVKPESEKLFTQEELDRIVNERLTRQKRSMQKSNDISGKEQELNAREARLNCREYLSERGYPAELIDIIDTTDFDGFKDKADRLESLLAAKTKKPQMRFVFDTGAPLGKSENYTDNLAKAFKPKK